MIISNGAKYPFNMRRLICWFIDSSTAYEQKLLHTWVLCPINNRPEQGQGQGELLPSNGLGLLLVLDQARCMEDGSFRNWYTIQNRRAEIWNQANLTESRSLPLLSRTTSNWAPPTASPTAAGSPHTVFPPASLISCKLPTKFQDLRRSATAKNGTGSYAESAERGFLHLIWSFVTNCQDCDIMARTQKLLCQVEPYHCMPAAVGVHYEHSLLLCRHTASDGEGAGCNMAQSWARQMSQECAGDWEGWREGWGVEWKRWEAGDWWGETGGGWWRGEECGGGWRGKGGHSHRHFWWASVMRMEKNENQQFSLRSFCSDRLVDKWGDLGLSCFSIHACITMRCKLVDTSMIFVCKHILSKLVNKILIRT